MSACPVRRRRSPASGVLALVLLLAGCTFARTSAPPAKAPLFADRVLVLPRVVALEDRPIVERAAELLAASLRSSRDAIGGRDLERVAAVAGLEAWARVLLARLEPGGVPGPEDREELLARFGIATLASVDVTRFDQVWARSAKFTRVGVGVELYDVVAGRVTWRAHSGAEVEDKRGRAFDFTMEDAVEGLVAAMIPNGRLSIGDAWRAWRR